MKNGRYPILTESAPMPLSHEEKLLLDAISARVAADDAPGARRPQPRQSEPNLTLSDFEEALPDFLMAAMRKAPTARLHPVARAWLRDKVSLGGIAERAFGSATSTDFGNALAGASTRPLLSGYSSVANLTGVLPTEEIPDFKRVEFLDLASSDPVLEIEEGEPQLAKITAPPTAAGGQLRTFGIACRVSKKVMYGAPEILARFWWKIGAQFARAELRRLVAVLESYSLPDGAWFDGGNSTTGGNDVAGFSAALTKMRKQVDAAGEVTGCGIGSILCPPELEAGFMQTRFNLQAQFKIVPLPWLASSGTWWAVAAPTEAQPLARLILSGTSGLPSVNFETVGAGETRSRGFCAAHDFEIAPLSRAGIIKVTPA